jgi:chromosomal replication initiation ATPase DnaA
MHRRRRCRLPEQVVRHILEHAVTHAFGVPQIEFWRLTRGQPHVALARQVGMYLAHVSFELSLTEVGVLFTRDRTTVAHACSVVEDRRDDPRFDRTIDLLEGTVRHLQPREAAVLARQPGIATAPPRRGGPIPIHTASL